MKKTQYALSKLFREKSCAGNVDSLTSLCEWNLENSRLSHRALEMSLIHFVIQPVAVETCILKRGHRRPGGRCGNLASKAQGIAGLAVAADHNCGIDARCPRQTLHFLASAKASQARGRCGPFQRWNYGNLGCKAAKIL